MGQLLNEAMKNGDMMSVFPVYEACWITFGVISGMMFYDAGTWWAMIRESLGVLPMLVGICFLVQHTSKKEAMRRLTESCDSEVQNLQAGGGSFYEELAPTEPVSGSLEQPAGNK